MSPAVTVQFLKNPGILHWGFQARLLGEDDYGKWLGLPRGSKRWKGEEVVRPSAEDAVLCAPHDGWWHLHYNGGASQYSHFVDIVTTPRWVSPWRYEMIDLDLDVAVRQDGSVEIQDEDEFQVHQIRYRYSQDMIERAVAETAWVVEALEARREPFFETASSWLSRV